MEYKEGSDNGYRLLCLHINIGNERNRDVYGSKLIKKRCHWPREVHRYIMRDVLVVNGVRLS